MEKRETTGNTTEEKGGKRGEKRSKGREEKKGKKRKGKEEEKKGKKRK